MYKTGSGLKGLNVAGRAEKKLTEVLERGMGWRMRQLLSAFFAACKVNFLPQFLLISQSD